ncbi:uncharacterized protein PRCAT00005697001 [Priceomyces carsonii]|uniref:uncharacterized protein n=1 Tax=Priceomyces carsonii TaxID=28549 RepID=UPI002ED88D5E|nr:unnamed protein product [Priceomyces carsonii]
MVSLYPLSQSAKFVFYFNVVFTTLWACCFIRFLILLVLVGKRFLPGGIADFFHVVSLAPLISFFYVKGLIQRKFSLRDAWSLGNAIRMVWICYGVIYPSPKIAKHTSYSYLILSWCMLGLIHYGYYSFKVKTGGSPRWLFWLKYHHFFVTFPLGFVSEMILTFLSLAYVDDGLIFEILLKTQLLSYVPLGYLTWVYLAHTKMEKYNNIIRKKQERRPREEQNENIASSVSGYGDNYQLSDMSSQQTNRAQSQH